MIEDLRGVLLAESQNNEQPDEPDAEARREGTMNDPLPRTDVEAPRVSFGDDPEE